MPSHRDTQPFDLGKIDYEAVRKRKRKRLLLWSLPAVIIVFIIALWFILPRLLTQQAIVSYDKNQFGPARWWLTPLTWTSPELFVSTFDSGTTDGQLRNYARAESELIQAVASAPNSEKRCMAAQNLVTVLNDHATSLKPNEKQAAAYTTKASTVTKENPTCFPPPPPPATISGGGGGGGSSNDSPSTSQQQQLEQKEQEGRERKAKYARDDGFDPNNPSSRPW